MMAVQFLQKQKAPAGPSTLDKVLQGAQLASTILQGAKNVQDIRKTSQELAAGETAAKTIADAQANENSTSSPDIAVLKPRAEVVGLTIPAGATVANLKRTGFYDQLKSAEEQARKIAESKASEGFKTEGNIAVEKVKGQQALAKEKFIESIVPVSSPEIKVNGLAVVQGASPTKADAEVVKKAIASKEALTSNINKMRKLIEKNGTELWPTQAKKDMAALRSDMLIQYKDTAGLGTLSEGDVNLVDPLLSDSISFSANLNPNGAASALHSLDTFQGIADSKFNAALNSRGYAVASDASKNKAPKGMESANAKEPPDITKGLPPIVVHPDGKTLVLQPNGKYKEQ